jgi:hypothetical protein
MSRNQAGGLAVAAALLWLAGAMWPALAFAGEPNRAGLVIQFGDGRLETHCIAFEEDELSGAELLTRSGLNMVVDASKGMGITVCKIQGVGCDYPAKHCFCQCMGGGECAYWNYFYRDRGEAEWTYSPLGAVLRRVSPGAVEAWVWGDGHTPPSRDLTFEAICASPTPTPTATQTAELATPLPRVIPAVQATAESPTQPPAPSPAVSTVTAWPAPSTPAPTAGPSLAGYWPFGLMALGLLVVGAVVWFRRRPSSGY